MKPRPWRKGRFTGRGFIRTSLIVAAWIIAAAAIVAGPCLAPSLAAETKGSKTDKVGTLRRNERGRRHAGEACRRGVEMWVDEVNGRGGLLGRKVEFVQRDTGGKPEEAVRWAREFAGGGDIDFLFASRFERRGLCRRLGFEGAQKVFLRITIPRTLRRIQKSGVLTASGRPQ